MGRVGFALAIALLATLSLANNAAAQTFVHANRGWWTSTDFSNNPGAPYTGNTYTGRNGSAHGSNMFRGYLLFDLTSLGTTVGSATLSLEFEGYFSTDPSETFSVFDYTGSTATLATALFAAGTYDDLGDGAVYGSATVTAADVGSQLSLTLTAAAISDINSAAGGMFALGLASQTVTGTGANNGVRFAAGTESRTHELELTTVPEPGSLGLLSFCLFGGVCTAIRRRRREA